MRKRRPILLSDQLKKAFDVSAMGPGMKRGMVLKIAPAKIREAVGRRGFANDLKSMKLSGEFERPELHIYLKSGSLWRLELHSQRIHIKKLINERLKCDFISGVKVF